MVMHHPVNWKTNRTNSINVTSVDGLQNVLAKLDNRMLVFPVISQLTDDSPTFRGLLTHKLPNILPICLTIWNQNKSYANTEMFLKNPKIHSTEMLIKDYIHYYGSLTLIIILSKQGHILNDENSKSFLYNRVISNFFVYTDDSFNCLTLAVRT